MLNDSDEEIGQLAAEIRRGSVVAAAGCGKTEQVVRAVELSKYRRLILTHTHAGVDAITKRLKGRKVANEKYRVDTIAGWCLRFAAAFPKRSGISNVAPRSGAEWNAVYAAASQLIQSGAICGVLEASYGGLLVDEYQDCTRQQHDVVRLLADRMPTCVFGDPLQAIFDFRGQEPVDWNVDVFQSFPKVGELTTPWRWKNVGNDQMAEWLKEVRRALERDEGIDLAVRPACARWSPMPGDPRFQHQEVIRQCLEALNDSRRGDLIVIGDSANVNARAALASKLARNGFSNIEPVGCKEIYVAAGAIERAEGPDRFKALLAFVCKCMTGAEKAGLEEAVESRLAGRRRGQAKFGDLFPIIDRVIEHGSEESSFAFLQAMQRREGTQVYRREMFFCMGAALKIKGSRQCGSLADAVWEVQNRIRHAGRKFGKRSIGSTLLVKGLEFDHAVVVHTPNLTRKEWYVALTRATRGTRVISPSERFTPPS
jgi:DNA helicase-2/ATP-dependent DNA helicase PcrA